MPLCGVTVIYLIIQLDTFWPWSLAPFQSLQGWSAPPPTVRMGGEAGDNFSRLLGKIRWGCSGRWQPASMSPATRQSQTPPGRWEPQLLRPPPKLCSITEIQEQPRMGRKGTVEPQHLTFKIKCLPSLTSHSGVFSQTTERGFGWKINLKIYAVWQK